MARKFSDLRPQTRSEAVADDDAIERVVARLARSRDGDLLLGWMLAEATRPSHPAASDATLREAEGVRAFVDRVLKMTEGV